MKGDQADDVERRFRVALLGLALTSNGRTTNWQSSVGDPDYTPHLGAGDAPEIALARAWQDADAEQREGLADEAEDTLRSIRHSSGNRNVVESKADRDQRILAFEGIGAREAAVHCRCGITDVWKAREAAGRETEYGRRPRNGRALEPEQRRAEVRRLVGDGMSARQVAVALALSYSTVRRDLATES